MAAGNAALPKSWDLAMTTLVLADEVVAGLKIVVAALVFVAQAAATLKANVANDGVVVGALLAAGVRVIN